MPSWLPVCQCLVKNYPDRLVAAICLTALIQELRLIFTSFLGSKRAGKQSCWEASWLRSNFKQVCKTDGFKPISRRSKLITNIRG
jgi:hypothetical protein